MRSVAVDDGLSKRLDSKILPSKLLNISTQNLFGPLSVMQFFCFPSSPLHGAIFFIDQYDEEFGQ